MAENYNEMKTRLMAKMKNSQKSEVKEVPKAKPKDEDEDFEDAFDEEESKVPEKAIEKKIIAKDFSHQENTTNKQEESQSDEEKIAMQIELLQNNGRYRAEKLFQMQEINKNLSLIAEILMGKDDKIN